MPILALKDKNVIGQELFVKDVIGLTFIKDIVDNTEFSAVSPTGVQTGGNITGSTIQTDKEGSRFFADRSNVTAYDDANAEIFKITMDGANVGDVTIGNYSGGQGVLWDKSDGTFNIAGTLTATAGTIGGFSIGTDYIRDTANSFGLASTVTGGDDVRFWAGATFANRATAPLRFYESGLGVFTDISITGGSVVTSVLTGTIAQGNLAAANLGWSQTCAFSSTDADTVSWGAGSFITSAGTTYSIDAGNTGNMAARTYIYLDTAVSTTAYQTTTTASTAVGAGKVLIATAVNGTNEALFTVFGGLGGINISGTDIESLSVTGTQIAAATITGGKIAAGTITASNIAAGTITTNEIAANTIVAGNIAAGTITGTQIAANTITAGNLSVTTLSAITADLGTITAGTITLDTAGYIRGGQTAYDTGTGFFLGYSGAAYKFSIGNASGNKMTWDGSTLSIIGTLAAGGTIGSTSASTVESNSNNAWIQLGETILEGAATSITVSGFPARKDIRIHIQINGSSGAHAVWIRFNNDSGSNYAYQSLTDGATGSSAGTQTKIILFETGADRTYTNAYCVLDVLNESARQKMVIGKAALSTDSAASSLQHVDIAGKWDNEVDQITRVDIISSDTDTFASGSRVTISAKKD